MSFRINLNPEPAEEGLISGVKKLYKKGKDIADARRAAKMKAKSSNADKEEKVVSSFEEGFDYAYETHKETGKVPFFRIQKYKDSSIDLRYLITSRTMDAFDTDDDTAKDRLKAQAVRVFQNIERSMPQILEASMKIWYDIKDDDYDADNNAFDEDVRKKATRDQVKSDLSFGSISMDFVSKSQIDVTMYIYSGYANGNGSAVIRVEDLANGIYKSVKDIDYFY